MQFIMLLMISILIVGGIQRLLMHRSDEIGRKKEVAADKLLAAQETLSMLIVKEQANRASEEKVQQKNQLIKEVAAKQRVLGSLDKIDLGLAVSFSELMLGLSKADIGQVSIDQFSVDNGKFTIQGRALHSDSVPLWLTHIQKTTELNTVSFSAVDIIEQENTFLFKLSNSDLKIKAKEQK